MSVNGKMSRRRLLGQALGAAAVSLSGCPGPSPTPPSSQPAPSQAKKPAPSPNEQIGVGIIGCGRRNGQLVIGKGGQGAPPAHARIVAVADFNMVRAEQWARNYRAKAYQDYRELLDRKDVDVVIYATPEHWHYLPCIHACQAGKDMYGEQPLSHTIREGRKMIEAVRKYQRVFQTGEQQRSHPATRKAVELIRNGRIGKIQSIIGYNYPSPYECNFPAQPIPAWLDWDAWCGPNEVVPYHTDLYLSRIPYEREKPYYTPPAEKYAVGPGWMSFRPYSGGELPNWGCHGLSMVHWALDMDHSGPVEIWVDPAEKLHTVVYDTPETRDRGDAACSQDDHPLQVCQRRGALAQLHRPEAGRRSHVHRRQGPDHDLPRGIRVRSGGPGRRSAPGRRGPRLRERQPHGELLRLRGLSQRPDHAGRGRAQRGHLVPPGQHRPPAGPPPEMGSGEGDLSRRRRGQSVS